MWTHVSLFLRGQPGRSHRCIWKQPCASRVGFTGGCHWQDSIMSLEDPKVGPLFVGIAASSTTCVATFQRRSGQLRCNFMLTSDHALAASPACMSTDPSRNNLPIVLGRHEWACGKKDALPLAPEVVPDAVAKALLRFLLGLRAPFACGHCSWRYQGPGLPCCCCRL